MQRDSAFLNFRPSQIAAASILFAINISLSEVASAIGVKKIEELALKSLFFETAIHHEVAGKKIEEKNAKCPLRYWNDSVQKLTALKREADINAAYKELVERLNKNWYENKLI